MKQLLIITLLAATLGTACGTATPTNVEPAPTSTTGMANADTACPLCHTWKATQLTIDGKNDPEMDPTDLVTLAFRADGSFQLKDATEGDVQELNGTWTLRADSVLALFAQDQAPFTDFKVVRLDHTTLVAQVLERAEEAVVLMHYTTAD